MTTTPYIGLAEPFSALSHFLGALACLYCGIKLVRAEKRSLSNKFALALFCFGCIFLLSMSGTFHLLSRETIASDVLQRLDHAAIFVLIAGTFTPIHTLEFKGFWRWGPLTFVWVFAIIGIVLKSIYFHDIPESLGLGIYLGMGWFGIVTGVLLFLDGGFALVKPLLFGALAYSAGAISEFMRSPTILRGVIGPHEIFHVAVLLGILFHWSLIRKLVDKPLATSDVT